MPRLNRTLIEKLEPPATGELTVMDSEVPNFGVRVLASGVKSFFVRYRVGGGRGVTPKRKSLGLHPTMTPEKARQTAKDYLAEARLGKDPAADIVRRRASLTVAELVNEWVAGPGKRTRKGRPKSARSFLSDKARLEHHVVPTIGGVKLCDLNRIHVERVRDAVAAGKTARDKVQTKPRGFSHVRGGEGVATRTVAAFSTVLGYAAERGYLPGNPALGVHKPKERRCERFLSTDEIKSLTTALEQERSVHPQAVHILRLLLLTGCRYSEIAGLRWDEVNLPAATIMLKDSKTGSRPVYLSSSAVSELRSVRRIEGSPFVFPSAHGDTSYQGTPKVWRKVCLTAGIGPVRIHDLRHTFASTALAEGAPLEAIAKLLGHKELRTTARYAHLTSDVVRRAADAVGQVVGARAAE